MTASDIWFGAQLVAACVGLPLLLVAVFVNVHIFPLLDQFGVPCPASLASSWQQVYESYVAAPLTTYLLPHLPKPLANFTESLVTSGESLEHLADRAAEGATALYQGLVGSHGCLLSWGTVATTAAAILVRLGVNPATAEAWTGVGGPFPYKTFVIAVSTAVYLFETYLSYRQHRKLKQKSRPATITTIVSQDDFQRANAYGLDKSRFSFIQSFVGQAQTLLFLHFDAIPWLWAHIGEAMWHLAGMDSTYEITQSVAFFMATTFITTLLSVPFNIYYTFVIEERHGFNKQTLGLFFADIVKGFAVGGAIGIPAISGFLRIIQWAGPSFYLYVWAFVVVLQITLITIYPTLIQPLFNKFTPLEAGDLRTRIEALAARVHFPLTQLYVIDGSRRSAHSNAYFYGFFKQKRIVLYDTLLEHTDTDEICAVLGHELGHWQMNHVAKFFLITQAHTFTLFYLFSRVINSPTMYESFGFHQAAPLLIGFMIFQYLYIPVESLMSFAMNVLSRHNEFEADSYAIRLGYAAPLSTALVKLQLKNLGNMNPDPWYSAYHYSHPPLVERLNAIEQVAAEEMKKTG
ncbi:zinc metalloprotease [Tieghemiomyces parasiticus]|uniref:Ste24 endopeptidase n=1 Tax=Tieghemiomyces parasiticus TaxID=78921 RepID=A0A9W8DMP3_9FUNG|nr:zinc metalloprotease [Tieghemiomyces parasiticus]